MLTFVTRFQTQNFVMFSPQESKTIESHKNDLMLFVFITRVLIRNNHLNGNSGRNFFIVALVFSRFRCRKKSISNRFRGLISQKVKSGLLLKLCKSFQKLLKFNILKNFENRVWQKHTASNWKLRNTTFGNATSATPCTKSEAVIVLKLTGLVLYHKCYMKLVRNTKCHCQLLRTS